MSNENLGAGARGDVCSFGAHLYLHDLLLLHEEVADTSQNDALKDMKDSFAERIRKSKWKNDNGECESSHIHSHTHTRILMS